MNQGGINETLGVGSSGRSTLLPPLFSSCVHLLTRASVGGANLMGADLYKNLQQYWINHLKEVRAVRPVPSCLCNSQ